LQPRMNDGDKREKRMQRPKLPRTDPKGKKEKKLLAKGVKAIPWTMGRKRAPPKTMRTIPVATTITQQRSSHSKSDGL